MVLSAKELKISLPEYRELRHLLWEFGIGKKRLDVLLGYHFIVNILKDRKRFLRELEVFKGDLIGTVWEDEADYAAFVQDIEEYDPAEAELDWDELDFLKHTLSFEKDRKSHSQLFIVKNVSLPAKRIYLLFREGEDKQKYIVGVCDGRTYVISIPSRIELMHPSQHVNIATICEELLGIRFDEGSVRGGFVRFGSGQLEFFGTSTQYGAADHDMVRKIVG